MTSQPPLLLTAPSDSLYGARSARRIDAFWLIRLHAGNFGAVQPWKPKEASTATFLIKPIDTAAAATS